jgi:hypothetical protein
MDTNIYNITAIYADGSIVHGTLEAVSLSSAHDGAEVYYPKAISLTVEEQPSL